MDKAKAAVSDFMKRSGHHDTTVHETVAPAVQHETVKQHEHENITTAVDKETHQDHYHRTVQPVRDQEILPETHTAKLGAVQHREFDHRDAEGSKHRLAEEAGQFRDQRTIHDTTHSQSAAPAVGGEHVHHHIHETIQPVVHKETQQANIVHTTVPIHEVHHNAAQHHDTSTLPAVNMSEFKNQGGVLGGREERYDGFEGEPKKIGGHGLRHEEHGHGGAVGGVGSERRTDGPTEGQREDLHSDSRTGNLDSQRASSGRTGGTDPVGRGYDDSSSTTKSKPSMMDKLNPMKDADGDGKAGFMK